LRRTPEEGKADGDFCAVRQREGFVSAVFARCGIQVTCAWLSLILAGAWADHCAEAAMYLRLNGVLPPTAKK